MSEWDVPAQKEVDVLMAREVTVPEILAELLNLLMVRNKKSRLRIYAIK